MSSLPTTPDEYRAWWAQQTDVPYGCCWCGCGQETTVPAKSCKSRLIFRGEPRMYRKGHHAATSNRNRMKPYEEKYIVDETTGCWLWQGSKNNGGYGMLKHKGEHYCAHVFYYERLVGPKPEGLDLDHLCRVRHCVNPSHLEPATRAKNVRRGDSTILTEDQVRLIRHQYDTLTTSYQELADHYGLSKSGVVHIVKRRRWKDV